MQTIATLTMNPALDKSTRTHHVAPEHKLRCAAVTVEPGGGGINVSRAIHQLGGDSRLIYHSGGLTGKALEQLILAAGLTPLVIPTSGWTRESFTVREESSNLQYRFGMPGPTLLPEEWQLCLETITSLDPKPDYLVTSGSLPPGAPDDAYLQIAEIAAGWGARVLVDTSGAALRSVLVKGGPVFLIKPNLRELNQLLETDAQDDVEIARAVQAIIKDGCCQVVVVSLGAAGVLLVTATSHLRIPSPTVPIVSKIGAGDSTVGGITLALARELPLDEAVRFGVAAGAAAVMTPGTQLCRQEDAERLYELMRREAM